MLGLIRDLDLGDYKENGLLVFLEPLIRLVIANAGVPRRRRTLPREPRDVDPIPDQPIAMPKISPQVKAAAAARTMEEQGQIIFNLIRTKLPVGKVYARAHSMFIGIKNAVYGARFDFAQRQLEVLFRLAHEHSAENLKKEILVMIEMVLKIKNGYARTG